MPGISTRTSYSPHARATASGLAYSLSRISTALLPFILIPVLYRAGAVAVFAVIGVATLIALADVVLFGPHTTGRPLEVVNPALAEEGETVSERPPGEEEARPEVP